MIDSGTLLLDRFLIEAKIGMGGMGAVYRAVDQKFGSLVAIKETFYADKELAEAFEREARLLNGLHHPILPHVSDCFTQNGGHFLVMEYIEGEDLSELLRRGERFPINTVIGWTLDILDGLDYLHSQNPPIIHRDIKPNNLKITSRGKIVLLDFGMAKETTGNTIGSNSVFGYSRRYSPLEQIEGTGTDARADIFSLGASVYYLLTGQPPADALARASAIVAGRPDPLLPANQLNPEVPESVSAILSSALTLSAEKRPASARDMLNALVEATDLNLLQPTQTSEPSIALPGGANNGLSAEAAGASHGSYETSSLLDQDGDEISLQSTQPANLDDRGVVTSVPIANNAVAGAAGNFITRALRSHDLRQRINSVLPITSTPSFHIRRPARPAHLVWLPIILLCVGLVLFGTYRGFKAWENPATVSTEPVIPEASGTGEDLPPDAETRTENVPAREVQASRVQDDETAVNAEDAPVVSDPDSTDSDDEELTSETTDSSELERARASDRPIPNAPAGRQRRPRRVAEPSFEQPSVSSIEAIMTGLPNEKSATLADDEETQLDDVRRRRIRRENRRTPRPY